MRTLLLLTACAFLATTGAALADPGKKQPDGVEGAILKVVDKAVEVFTGDGAEDKDSPGAHGRENAAEQIEKNIDKHGGEHKGLENALSNKKGPASGISSIEDEIIEDIATGVKDEINDTLNSDAPPTIKGKSKSRSNSDKKSR